MTFDRQEFRMQWGEKRPWEAVADELERLHAKIAALKAQLSAHPEPKTGWAVVEGGVGGRRLAFCRDGWISAIPGGYVLPIFFFTREDAEMLVRALGTGRAAKLNRETLEEVE